MQPLIMQEKGKWLTREQKQAVGLLSMGTFLEYFDALLFVHMAILLDELFFPKFDDPFINSLITASTISITYLLRPFSALIFGWLGDNIGRKSTVIITTAMMSLSCLIMANLPTYEQIGITAVWLITICRIMQGMSSMGEIVGAELYLSEMVTGTSRNFIVSLITVLAASGGFVALAIASLTTSFGFNWRIAFWFGAAIAIVGVVARTTLRETPEFVNAKLRMQRILERANKDPKILDNNPIVQEKVNKKTMLALFFISCAGPVWFYIAYLYCGDILKIYFHFTPEQVIHQNFIVSLIEISGYIIMSWLIRKIHPLKLLAVISVIFFYLMIIFAVLLDNLTTPWHVLAIQIIMRIFGPTGFPAYAIFYMYFPVFKRFTYVALVVAVSDALIFPVTSFGLTYLTNYFDHYGLYFFIIPILIGFTFGLLHFIKLEVAAGNYYDPTKSCGRQAALSYS